MTIASSFPGPPSRTGLRLREKKSLTHVEGPYLDAAVADFSGYLAVDELYDGPFCILLAVDPRQQRRLMYEVLDHDPARLDIFLFLLRLNEELRNRGKTVEGITTDGSSLYPVPIPLVFGSIRHQVCRFHIIKEVIQAINKVLSGIRKELHAQIPKLPSGRSKNTPRNQEKKQRVQALKQHVSELFKHRKLFVKRTLSEKERTILQELTRSDKRLQAVRSIMEEVYRLFDRRCSTATALTKLTKLRKRLGRYEHLEKVLDKLNSPNLEKALTYLDDKLLESTSNAVERGNRRYRKMQKSVYSRRTAETIKARLALDLQREEQDRGRRQTLECLHAARS